MPSLFKRSNGIWYIVYEVEGKRKWASTGVRKKNLALNQFLNFEKRRKRIEPKITLEEFVSLFLSYAVNVYSQKTGKIYRDAFRQLQRVVSHCLLTSLTPKHFDLYKSKRLKEVSPVTVNIELRTLRAALNTAVRWNYVSKNPLDCINKASVPEKAPTSLTMEEFARLIAVIEDDTFRALVRMASFTGMRRSEVLNLRWSDVDLARQVIYIRNTESFTTKSKKNRVIPMHSAVKLVLGRIAKAGEYVFVSRAGEPYDPNYVSRRFKMYARRAGLREDLHFHSLRHTFATWLVQEGVSIYEVQKLLGHSSVSVTQVYSHLAASELHGAVNKIQVVLN